MLYNKNLTRQTALIKLIAIKCLFFTVVCLSWINANAADEKIIIAFGDSLIAGDGVDSDETITYLLEETLNTTGENVRIINEGVSGDTTADGLKRLNNVLDRHQKIDLFILELGANDILRQVPIDSTQKNLDNILETLATRKIPTLMAGMILPFNGFEGFTNNYNDIFSDLALKHDIPLYPFYLEGVAGVPELNQSDRLHPNGFGNKVIASLMSPIILDTLGNIQRYNEIQALLNTNLATEINVVEPSSNIQKVTNIAEEKTILAFGDSLTAGYGLDPKDGFTNQLERTLNENGVSVKVMNAGVSGDTSSGGFARLEWVIGSTPDIDLVILTIGANDALRGIHPDLTRRNIDKMVGILTSQNIPTLIAGMMAPPNLGKVYGDNFNSIYPDIAQKYNVPLYPFFLEGVAGNLELNQSDTIHPNPKGVEIITEKMAPVIINLLEN